MIVCICNNISSKVLDAYRSRGLSLEDLRQDYGLASNCGQCLATAEHMMTRPKNFSSNELIPTTSISPIHANLFLKTKRVNDNHLGFHRLG